jgi:hypothetical protein
MALETRKNGDTVTASWFNTIKQMVENFLTATPGGIVFGDTDGTLTQDSGLHWDNSNKRLGIGTNNPSVGLDVSGEDGNSFATLRRFNTNGGPVFRHYMNRAANPSTALAPLNNSRIALWEARAPEDDTDTSVNGVTGAEIRMRADEDWDSGGRGSKIELRGCLNGTTSLVNFVDIRGEDGRAEMRTMPEVTRTYTQRTPNYASDSFVPFAASNSTSEGRWTAFADGTLMQWINLSGHASGSETWVFPFEFHSLISVQSTIGSSAARYATNTGVGTTQATILSWDSSGSAVNSATRNFAIGRWKAL